MRVCVCRWERDIGCSNKTCMKSHRSVHCGENAIRSFPHCKYFPLKIWVNTSLFNFLAYISMLCDACEWLRMRERERKRVEVEWGLKPAKKNEIKKRGEKKKARASRAGDRLSRRKGRCGSMWGMSVTLMNYLRHEIPRPSRGLFRCTLIGKGVGWMSGAVRTPYPILHPCHRSSNPQCCAANGDWGVASERPY